MVGLLHGEQARGGRVGLYHPFINFQAGLHVNNINTKPERDLWVKMLSGVKRVSVCSSFQGSIQNLGHLSANAGASDFIFFLLLSSPNSLLQWAFNFNLWTRDRAALLGIQSEAMQIVVALHTRESGRASSVICAPELHCQHL